VHEFALALTTEVGMSSRTPFRSHALPSFSAAAPLHKLLSFLESLQRPPLLQCRAAVNIIGCLVTRSSKRPANFQQMYS